MINAKKAKRIYENGILSSGRKRKRRLKKIIKEIFKDIKFRAKEGCIINSSNAVEIKLSSFHVHERIWYSTLEPSERALILRKLLEKQFDASFDDRYNPQISWDIKNDK